jgi:hypothetical protein
MIVQHAYAKNNNSLFFTCEKYMFSFFIVENLIKYKINKERVQIFYDYF